MMPRSHFLFGIFAGAVASIFVQDFSLFYIFIAGVAAVLVDIDHFICHMFSTGDFSPAGMWKRCFNDKYKKHLKDPVYRSKFVHGWKGLIILTILILPLAFYNPLIAISVYAGYYSHLSADWLASRKFYRSIKPYILEIRHLMYPVYVDELIFDVFVFNMAAIIILYRGLI
ncbi:MAG: metal-dependent hydrolase [Candidatus Undinarchaeales archaeon]|jgi:hypothetical protein|nr:metal-dependent hydrolase [Candidatus Undinarchaeales archaeon]